MHLRQAALVALATICVTAELASAGTIKASFDRLEALDKYYSLVVAGGDRYVVSEDVHRRYRKVFAALKPGAKIDLAVKGKILLSIKPSSAATAITRVSKDGVFMRYDAASERIWFKNGNNYGLGELKRDSLTTLHTLNPQERVRIVLDRGLVVEIVKVGSSIAEEAPAVRRILDASRGGDEIQLRKQKDPQFFNFRIRTVRATEVVLVPFVSGRPSGTVTYRRSDIAEVVNPAAEKRLKQPVGPAVGPGEEAADPFSGVRVGDMIGIALDKGQLTQLDEDTYTLRIWSNGRWEPSPKPEPRTAAKKVRFEPLTHSQTVNIDGGQINLEVTRARSPQKGLTFDVALSHNVKTALLVGFEVRFVLSRKPCMTADDPGEGAVVKTVSKALFVGQRYTLSQTVPSDEFLDGRVEVRALPRHVVDLRAEDARTHLMSALERWNQPLEDLSGALRAAAANGDASLCKVLIGHAVILRERLRSGKATDHAADLELELRKSLDDFGGMTPRLIMETLFGQDRRLRHWIVRGGGVEQSSLPSDLKPLGYKRGLIKLLAQLKAGLNDATGRRLFDLYLERSEDFKEEILQAFRGQPEAAVASLLHVAIDIKDKDKADQAAILLRGLGEPVLPALFADLRARKVDPSPLEGLIKAGKNPDLVVSKAVDLLVKRAHDDAGRERLRQVELADEARGQGDFAKALKIVRGVLAQKKRHSEASSLLPRILLEQGRRLLSDGKKGLAAISLQEAAETFKGPAAMQPRKILAGMLVDGAGEEVDAIVMRSAPHAAAEVVTEIPFGSQLESNASNASAFDEWVSVQTKDGKLGFARSKVVSKTATGFRVSAQVTPYAVLEEQLKLAKTFDPAMGPRVTLVMGQMAAREAEIRYKNGEFEAALAFFEIAKRDAPNDPRLSHYTACWAKANTAMLGGVAAVILLGLGFGVLAIFSRPKKVKFSGEYKHYGQERVRETEAGGGEE